MNWIKRVWTNTPSQVKPASPIFGRKKDHTYGRLSQMRVTNIINETANKSAVIHYKLENDSKPVWIVVKKGTKVTVSDPLNTAQAVHVISLSRFGRQSHSMASDYVYDVGNVETNNNVSVYFPEQQERPAEDYNNQYIGKVVCRHLVAASVQARVNNRQQWKDWRVKNFALKALPKLFYSEKIWNQKADVAMSLPVATTKATQEQFGQYLNAYCARLADKHAHMRNITVRTNVVTCIWFGGKHGGHVVHLMIDMKKKNGHPVFKIKGFDPNTTLGHTAITTDNFDVLSRVSFNALFPSTRFAPVRIISFQEQSPDSARELTMNGRAFSTHMVRLEKVEAPTSSMGFAKITPVGKIRGIDCVSRV